TGDGILYSVMDNFLDYYNTFVNTPIISLSQSDAGNMLKLQAAWTNAIENNVMQAYEQNGVVTLVSTASDTVTVPVTGTTFGSVYGGDRSGMKAIGAGATVKLTISSALAKAKTTLQPTTKRVSNSQLGHIQPPTEKVVNVKMSTTENKVTNDRPGEAALSFMGGFF
ncbi:unnamed protein product, partial [marine sediment metagenome]